MQRPLRYDVTNIITRSKRATKESRNTPRHYRVKHKEPELTDQFRFLKFVEARGLEPLTLCLQSRCATNCAMPPEDLFDYICCCCPNILSFFVISNDLISYTCSSDHGKS